MQNIYFYVTLALLTSSGFSHSQTSKLAKSEITKGCQCVNHTDTFFWTVRVKQGGYIWNISRDENTIPHIQLSLIVFQIKERLHPQTVLPNTRSASNVS